MRVASILVVGILGSVAAAFVQKRVLEEIVVSNHVYSKDGTDLEVIGACQLKPGMQMDCWTLDGKPSVVLGKNATNGLRAGSSGNLQLKPGKPSVFAVYRQKKSPGHRGWIGPVQGSPIWLHSDVWPGEKGQRHEHETSMTQVIVRDGIGALVLEMNEQRARGSLRLKVGQSADLGGKPVRVVSIKGPANPSDKVEGLPVRSVVEIAGDIQSAVESVKDEKGKWLGAVATTSNALSFKRESTWQMEKTPTGVRLFVSVPPERLGTVEFSGIRTVRLVFMGIPLKAVR